MHEHVYDKMRVLVGPDSTTSAEAAARHAAGVLREAIAARGVAHAMFATGNSQLEFIEALVGNEDPGWRDVVVLHMDEYVGIGPEHPASFQRYIRERIVERVNPLQAYLIRGDTGDPAGECDRYATLVRQHPLDLCCLGIGENGHLAFNDPPVADFRDPLTVKVVELDHACRAQQVGEGHFASIAEVPERAMTVTIPALVAARAVIGVVPEARKAQPVRSALTGPVSTACPASVLRTLENTTLYLDRDSAALL